MLTFLIPLLFLYYPEITQLWSNNSDLTFFVHHHSTSHDNSVCESIKGFSYQQAKEIDLACYDGWTDLGVFVYFNNFNDEECQGCQPPNNDDDEVVAYYFEVRNLFSFPYLS